MDDEYIIVEGATVIGSNNRPAPHNPLNRPKISLRIPIILLSVFLVGTVLIAVTAILFDYRIAFAEIAFICILAVLFAKRTAIWLVHFYQNKASDATRLRCVFEPSCSEYMILAINKYGLIRGAIKGIKRLSRCHNPNGGIDYP